MTAKEIVLSVVTKAGAEGRAVTLDELHDAVYKEGLGTNQSANWREDARDLMTSAMNGLIADGKITSVGWGSVRLSGPTVVDLFHNALSSTGGPVIGLYELADAFKRTGNEGLAQELRLYALQLEESHRRMDSAFGALLSQYVNAAGNTLPLMMNSALAALAVEKVVDGGNDARD